MDREKKIRVAFAIIKEFPETMPTYTYRREDGTTFEVEQSITEDPLEECPETGQSVERLIDGGAGVHFSADGFYSTDTDNASNPASDPTGS